MAEPLIELLAAIFTLVLFLIIAFYLYPRMKKEYKTHGWTWKRYYDVCGDDNRQTYRELFLNFLKK